MQSAGLQNHGLEENPLKIGLQYLDKTMIDGQITLPAMLVLGQTPKVRGSHYEVGISEKSQ